MRVEELEEKILQSCKDLSRQDLDRIVEEKLKSSPFLTRLGALLIVLEEIGLSGEDGLGGHHDYSFTPMSALTAGLKNVSVVGRVLGCKTFSTEDGRSFSRLRLWDGTGAVDVMVWESEQSASVGDVVAVWNGYVSTPKSGSGLVLHTGSRSRVEKMQDLGKLPPLDFSGFNLSASRLFGRRTVDVSAVVVLNTGVKAVEEETRLLELLVSDGEAVELFTAWRDWADLLSDVAEGARLMAASVNLKDGELHTGPNSLLTIVGFDEDVLARALDKSVPEIPLTVLGRCFDGVLAATDGSRMLRLGFPAEAPHKNVVVERAFVIQRRGIPQAYGKSIRSAQENHLPPAYTDTLDDSEGRICSGLVDCKLVRKTPLTTVETRFGSRKISTMWVEHGGKTYSCSAWGLAAEKTDELHEGSRLRMAFINVRRNKYGETEIILDGKSFLMISENQVK
ncbi:MAG: hypothetical protein QXS50_06865 [Candidatus Caldarchaeum sp.]